MRAVDVLALQRWIGNQAVARLLSDADRRPPASTGLAGPGQAVLQRAHWTWSHVKAHVMYGEYTGGRRSQPTGYHFAGRSNTHETYGPATQIDTTAQGDAVVAQSVRAENRSGGRSAYQVKYYQSNFFPATVGGRGTTEADLKNAVESAGDRRDKAVQTPAEWRGIVLTGPTDTVYPRGDETTRRRATPLPDDTKDS